MAIRISYLDASAALKLVLKEKGSAEVQGYMAFRAGMYMTSLCLVEALSTLKRFFVRGQLKEEDYRRCCAILLHFVRGDPPRIHIDTMDLMNQSTFLFCDDLVKEYHLDYSDALQLVTIKHGRFRDFVGESKTLLITADRQLAEAAKKEGLWVWNCIETAQPTPFASKTP